MGQVVADSVEKVYDNGFRAVTDFNLTIKDGEFLVLVGPSGCGKSTALRMIAGLESITSGKLTIAGRVVNDLEPKDRDIAMVFQSYALYPHLSVRDNIGFALKLQKLDREEIARRVDEAANILELNDYLDVRPGRLSGGQRQRVAMGRAIVRQPQVFLMDEPLSNLDAKLRVQMRAEISKLQRRLGVTTVYVTHDQIEAMTMGDRVAVMSRGKLQQVDTPQNLYDHPANLFVATFIGSPQMNVMRGLYAEGFVRAGSCSFPVSPAVNAARPSLANYEGRQVALGIRPEDLEDEAFASDRTVIITGVVEVREGLGSEVLLHVRTDVDSVSSTDLADAGVEHGTEKLAIVARVSPQSKAAVGDNVRLAVRTANIHLFDLHTGETIV